MYRYRNFRKIELGKALVETSLVYLVVMPAARLFSPETPEVSSQQHMALQYRSQERTHFLNNTQEIIFVLLPSEARA
ncbi:hypothetical protein EI94DRAFT_1767630 [Lactarius quietus]|nr:hypothetical protein EI94DRAFT_1767630 [Lactarius quietus]